MSRLKSIVAGAALLAALAFSTDAMARRVSIDQINFIDTLDETSYDLPFQVNVGTGLSSRVYLRIGGIDFLNASDAVIGTADSGVQIDPVFSAAEPNIQPEFNATFAGFGFGLINFAKSVNIAYISPMNDAINLYDLSESGSVGDFGMEFVHRGTFESTGQQFNLAGFDTSTLNFGDHQYLFRFTTRQVVGNDFLLTAKFLFRNGKFVDNFDFDYPAPRPASAPVPESPIWAMMIAGFGLVGSAMRMRHKRLAAL